MVRDGADGVRPVPDLRQDRALRDPSWHPGHDPSYNPYPSGDDDAGDLTRARAELDACGRPHGFAAKFAYSTPEGWNGAGFLAVRTALARVGITVAPATASARDYYRDFVGSPASVRARGLGLIDAGWGAELPAQP